MKTGEKVLVRKEQIDSYFDIVGHYVEWDGSKHVVDVGYGVEVLVRIDEVEKLAGLL